MPADPVDIASGIRPARVETWADPAIKARYPSARDGSVEPAEGFFDNAAHGAAALAQRGALVGVERRRFLAEVDGLQWLDPANGVPTVTIRDPEQKLDGPIMLTRIELNLEAERTTVEGFG